MLLVKVIAYFLPRLVYVILLITIGGCIIIKRNCVLIGLALWLINNCKNKITSIGLSWFVFYVNCLMFRSLPELSLVGWRMLCV